MASRPTATVLLVEDEIAIREELTGILEREGYRVLAESHPDRVIEVIRGERRIDVAVMDLQLPMRDSKLIGPQEAAGGRRAGLVLAGVLRRRFKRTPIIFWSDKYDREVRSELVALGNSRLISKRAGPAPVLDRVGEALDGFKSGTRPKIFIVHGHDGETMLDLKVYLESTLRLPAPVVLRDTPSYTSTLIEKLEASAESIDIVLVLLTPDDEVISSDDPAGRVFRARQNVIFELGYFLGLLGRVTGRVVLLYRRPVDMPSDIAGIVAIDVTDGIYSARKELNREFESWLEP